jgi:hypothetical protein
MKYIITENRLNKVVVLFLEHLFKDGIYKDLWIDSETNEENENLIMFYDDDYKNNIEYEPLFEYIFKEYYDNLDAETQFTLINRWGDKAPVVEILRNDFVETLNSTFGIGENGSQDLKYGLRKHLNFPLKQFRVNIY